MSFYWCTDHQRVETDEDRCPANAVLGPYKSRAEAQSALDRIHARNEKLDEEDRRWRKDD